MTWLHLTQSPLTWPQRSHRPGIRGRSPVIDRSRRQRSWSRVRLSCVPVILLADCWTIMGFAAVLRIYKFWLNYWFTICPNNFTKFVCMHQFWARPLKTLVWKQVIEVYFCHDLWLNVFSWHFWSLFRAMLLFPWMFSIVMTRIMDLRFLFCTPSISLITLKWQVAGIKKKKLKLSRSVSRFMKIEKICDNWIGCGERKPWWGLM